MSNNRVLSFSLLADDKVEIEVPKDHQIIVEVSHPNKMTLSTAPAVVVNHVLDRKTAFSNTAKIGQVIEDGSIYAGISPTNNYPFFIPVTDKIKSSRASMTEKFVREAMMHSWEDWQISTPEELAYLFANRLQGELHKLITARRKYHWCRTPQGTVRAFNQRGEPVLSHSGTLYFIPVRYQL